ncbi:hypothetical protein OG196_22350 [Kitasatospora purpeofusca]|nr:hypothetical protein OG196_22350 [Kitasatospora purpeofusca]
MFVGAHEQPVEPWLADYAEDRITASIGFLICGNVVTLVPNKGHRPQIDGSVLVRVQDFYRIGRISPPQHSAHVRRDEPRLAVDHHHPDRLARDREARPDQLHPPLHRLFVVHLDAPPSSG